MNRTTNTNGYMFMRNLGVLLLLISIFIVVYWKVFVSKDYYLPVSTSYHELAYNFSLRELAAREWNSLRIPFWNPYLGFGMPLMTDGNTCNALSPAYILYFIFTTPYMLGITQIIHILLLSFFTYRFVYELTRDTKASIAAGIVASMNGYTLISYLHSTSYVNAVTMLPLILLVVERYMRNPGQVKYLSLVAILTGLMFFMALIPSCVFVFFAAYLYAIMRLFYLRHHIRSKVLPFKVFIFIHVAFLAGILIGGIQLFPIYGFLGYATRDLKVVDYFARAGLSIWRFCFMAFNMLFPHFFGVIDKSISFKNMFLGVGNFEYLAGVPSLYFYCYFGIISIFLVMISFFKLKENRFFVFYAISFPLLLLLLRMEIIKKALYIITSGLLFNMNLNFSIEIFFMCAVPLLVGIGMNSITSLDRTKLKKLLILLLILSSLFIFIYMALNIYLVLNRNALNSAYHILINRRVSSGEFVPSHSLDYYHGKFDFFFNKFIENLPLSNFKTAFPLFTIVGFLASGCFVMKNKLSLDRFKGVILCLLICDLMIFSTAYIITVPRKDFLPEFSFMQYLRNDREPFRVAGVYSDDYVRRGNKAYKMKKLYRHFDFSTQMDNNPLLVVTKERQTEDYQWCSNILLHYGTQSILGADTFVFERYRNYLNAVEGGRLAQLEPMVFKLFNYKSRLLDLGNVKYLLSTVELEPEKRFEKVFAEGKLMVFKNKNVLPRAFFVENWVIEERPDLQLARLLDENFDFVKAAILEEEPLTCGKNPEIRPKSECSERIHILKYSNNSVIISASVNRPGIVVLLDQYFPGWKVFVDGVEKKIIRTDYLFRGVYVSAGAHTIEFKYRPEKFTVYLIVSTSVFLGCILFYLKQARNEDLS